MPDSDDQEQTKPSGTCLLWESGAWADGGIDGGTFDCSRCGHYLVVGNLAAALFREDDLRPYLSAATRQFFEQSGHKNFLVLTPGNWREYAERHERTRVTDRLNKLLAFIGAES